MRRLILILLLFAYSCNKEYVVIESKSDSSRLILERGKSPDKINPVSCEQAEYTQWGFLFNSIPINTLKPDKLFPDSTKSYRIYQKVNWKDGIISFFLGYTTSITRATYVVESCSTEMQVSTKEDVEARVDELVQKKIAENLEIYLEEKEKEKIDKKKVDFCVILKSKEKVEGQLLKMEKDTITLKEYKTFLSPTQRKINKAEASECKK